MSYSVRVQKTVSEGNMSVARTATYTTEEVTKKQLVVPDATTNDQVLMAIDISEIQVFSMVSDVAMTVATNDATTGSPQETFTLAAGKPVIWEDGDTAIFAGDVADIYVTNASGGAGQLDILFG